MCTHAIAKSRDVYDVRGWDICVPISHIVAASLQIAVDRQSWRDVFVPIRTEGLNGPTARWSRMICYGMKTSFYLHQPSSHREARNNEFQNAF